MSVLLRKNNITITNTDSPLRRSEFGTYNQTLNVTINDDEAERREARRRTILQGSRLSESATESLENNTTLKKCLKFYQDNKFSRDNAWSLSLIDTLSTLLNRHHRSLGNFKVAGNSLEASSKVYSLRVDSIHLDILRMTAGLNAQAFDENIHENDIDDENNDVATVAVSEVTKDPDDNVEGPENEGPEGDSPKRNKTKRLKCMITKNKDTINGCLETLPLQDPIFGKLNSTLGSANSSNRLMNNVLRTIDSVLQLRTTLPFWNDVEITDCDYTEEYEFNEDDNIEWTPCDHVVELINDDLDDLQLRPVYRGYCITDTPAPLSDINKQFLDAEENVNDDQTNEDIPIEPLPNGNIHEMSVIFDTNADCDPQSPCQLAPILDVNYEELDDLTTEEQNAINNCRSLRREPITVEDLRPVNSISNLEYSYRPVENISQFWAGPSHWKFKKTRARSTNLFSEQRNTESTNKVVQFAQRKDRRNYQIMEKRKQIHLNFCEFRDENFITLEKFKNRKVNIQKKWDQRKLKLPIDFQLSSDLFQNFTLAPGLRMYSKHSNASSALQIYEEGNDDNDIPGGNTTYDGYDPFIDRDCTNCNNNINDLPAHAEDELEESAVLEITTHFDGAPNQVTRIVIPFAKRAKIIDMKALKNSCNVLLKRQLQRLPPETEQMPEQLSDKYEHYEGGLAKFTDIYKSLPTFLTQNMIDEVSPSVAFYSILHLANEHTLRLISQDNLEDFYIRKIAA